MKYEMTKHLEDLLDQIVKLNETYKNEIYNGNVNQHLKNKLLELIDLVCKELIIQQIDFDFDS